MTSRIHLALACLASLAFVAGCAGIQHKSDGATEHAYQCESGQTIHATYPSPETASVRYQDRELDMIIAISASGARYVGHGLEWWTKGSGSSSEGMLLRHLANGSSGEILEICTAL